MPDASPAVLALLAAAGLLGGVVNAVAGGATLITFPAMLAAGLTPVVANASSAVALAPGYLIAAFADRGARPSAGPALWLALGAALAGGALGALLLLVTPDEVFLVLVPVLVAAGTALYAFSRRIEAAVAGTVRLGHRLVRPLALLPATVYGGYFGAGLGVILLAVLRITGDGSVRENTALKNLCSSVVRAVAVLIFTVAGSVSWPETAIMAVGALGGGFLGGRLVKVLPGTAIYWIVTGIGVTMTLWYAGKYWV